MSQLTDHIAALEKIATQSQELIAALQSRAEQPTVADQIAASLQDAWGGKTFVFPENDASRVAARLIHRRLAEAKALESGQADWKVIALRTAQAAYSKEMERLTSGVMGCSPEALPEWLASVQRSTERLLLLRETFGGGQESAPPAATQS